MQLPSILIEDLVRSALKEDLGHGLDITSQMLIPQNINTRATFRAREEGVLAGLILGLSCFSHVDPEFSFEIFAQDGEVISPGQEIAIIEGPAAALLTAERSALNFLIHLSGIATLTRRYVLAVQGTKAKIADTRKTLAGLRAVQKYAVRAGGGSNHRFGLDDAILIKDNHIAVAGGITQALNTTKQNAGHTTKIEIEVDTIDQLKDVLQHGGADIVMLDNFEIDDLKHAIDIIDGRIISEASGGVTLHTVKEIAQTGVDYISVGALTHSAPALDIGLDIE
ncbi:MAG: carboxylating nicotinate-nucleotide diphosphorylase [Alphaproteobacteria bacterium]